MNSIARSPTSRAAAPSTARSTESGTHLGVVQYLRGDFAEAAASFAKAQPIAPDAGELAGSTDWLWMSLSRAGRGAEAKAMLDRRPDSKPVTNALHAAPAALSWRDRSGSRAHAGGYRRRAGRHARLRPGELVLVRGDNGAGAQVVRAIDPVGRLARVRIHRVGGGAPPASLRPSGRGDAARRMSRATS